MRRATDKKEAASLRLLLPIAPMLNKTSLKLAHNNLPVH